MHDRRVESRLYKLAVHPPPDIRTFVHAMCVPCVAVQHSRMFRGRQAGQHSVLLALA